MAFRRLFISPRVDIARRQMMFAMLRAVDAAADAATQRCCRCCRDADTLLPMLLLSASLPILLRHDGTSCI